MKKLSFIIRTVAFAMMATAAFHSCKKPEPVEEQLVGRPGNPRFNLQFDNEENVDLDLYVTDPRGETISYLNPYSNSGGELDVDCLCGNCFQGPSENIFWPEDDSAPRGRYRFWVEYYGQCNNGGNTASSYTVRVTMNRQVVATYQGTLSSGSSQVWIYEKN